MPQLAINRTLPAPRFKLEQRQRRKFAQHARAHRERVRVKRLVQWIRRECWMTKREREWRILLLTMPDTRSLIGRLVGDPVYERSALYAKRMGWI